MLSSHAAVADALKKFMSTGSENRLPTRNPTGSSPVRQIQNNTATHIPPNLRLKPLRYPPSVDEVISEIPEEQTIAQEKKVYKSTDRSQDLHAARISNKRPKRVTKPRPRSRAATMHLNTKDRSIQLNTKIEAHVALATSRPERNPVVTNPTIVDDNVTPIDSIGDNILSSQTTIKQIVPQSTSIEGDAVNTDNHHDTREQSSRSGRMKRPTGKSKAANVLHNQLTQPYSSDFSDEMNPSDQRTLFNRAHTQQTPSFKPNSVTHSGQSPSQRKPNKESEERLSLLSGLTRFGGHVADALEELD